MTSLCVLVEFVSAVKILMLVFVLQNMDGSCIQSINLIMEQDQRKQVTLTQAGDVLVYDQYKINLPYTDGEILLWPTTDLYSTWSSYIIIISVLHRW